MLWVDREVDQRENWWFARKKEKRIKIFKSTWFDNIGGISMARLRSWSKGKYNLLEKWMKNQNDYDEKFRS